MTEGKQALIQGLSSEYDIGTADDIQDALKDLLAGTIQGMLECEMDDHLVYDKYERSSEPDHCNGAKSKTVRSRYGGSQVDVPQDRNSSFKPKIVPKRKENIPGIEDKVIPMYAKGMTTTQISEMIEDIYSFGISEGMVSSDITDKLLPEIEDWQNWPLSAVYPIIFIDGIRSSVRNDGVATYVVLGINADGYKEVLRIVVGENESSKYWSNVLDNLKGRGVQDILRLCSDGLTGLKEDIQNSISNDRASRCMVRNALKYVANKDMKAFARDVKTLLLMMRELLINALYLSRKSGVQCIPSTMDRWYDNCDLILPIFKSSVDGRTAFYTNNAIESLDPC